MKKLLLIIVLSSFTVAAAISQDTITHIRVPAKIVGNDTLPVVDIGPSIVFPGTEGDTKRILMRYDRLVYNVRIVYPYAKLAAEKLTEYRDTLSKMQNEKDRKKYIKKAEKELEDQFGDRIRDMTFSQGKILIKLIYRETGNSSYDIVKQLRGGFTAFVWQTMAKLFGYDLKTQYDPAGDDQAIERIVLMIEAGEI